MRQSTGYLDENLLQSAQDLRLGMRGYTGTGKVPVFIIFQTVRYHNFAQFGIRLQLQNAPVGGSASQIAAQTGKMWQQNKPMDQQIKLYQRIRN